MEMVYTGACYQRNARRYPSYSKAGNFFSWELTLEQPEELPYPISPGQYPMNSFLLTNKELLGLWMAVPKWTDRILFRSLLHYNRLKQIKQVSSVGWITCCFPPCLGFTNSWVVANGLVTWSGRWTMKNWTIGEAQLGGSWQVPRRELWGVARWRRRLAGHGAPRRVGGTERGAPAEKKGINEKENWTMKGTPMWGTAVWK